MHSGLLSKDAPGFSELIKGLLPADWSRLEAIYLLSSSHGGLEEAELTRPEGASFNPRPARIAQILISEVKELDPITLGGALLVNCPHIDRITDCTYERESILAMQARNAYAPYNLPRPAERIYLAYHLDILRHLHISKIEDSSRLLLYEKTKIILQCIDNSNAARLGELIFAWVERFERKTSKIN